MAYCRKCCARALVRNVFTMTESDPATNTLALDCDGSCLCIQCRRCLDVAKRIELLPISSIAEDGNRLYRIRWVARIARIARVARVGGRFLDLGHQQVGQRLSNICLARPGTLLHFALVLSRELLQDLEELVN